MPTDPALTQSVGRNLALARHWLSTALTNGYPQAANLLNEVAPRPHPV